MSGRTNPISLLSHCLPTTPGTSRPMQNPSSLLPLSNLPTHLLFPLQTTKFFSTKNRLPMHLHASPRLQCKTTTDSVGFSHGARPPSAPPQIRPGPLSQPAPPGPASPHPQPSARIKKVLSFTPKKLKNDKLFINLLIQALMT